MLLPERATRTIPMIKHNKTNISNKGNNLEEMKSASL